MGSSFRIKSNTPRGWRKAGLTAMAATAVALSAYLQVQATPGEKGDINSDGVVNVVDVTALGNLVVAGTPPSLNIGDINEDGVVNEADVQALAELIADGSAEPPGLQEITIMLPGDVPLVMLRIPAGTFVMGSPSAGPFGGERSRFSDEGPQTNVTISRDFYMGKYEVTQAQWLALMVSWPATAPSASFGVGPNHPAYYVSWTDAQSFILALNNHISSTSQGSATMRLPTEAEWEYAARAGTTTRFSFGDSLINVGGESQGDWCENDGIRSQYMWYCGNNAQFGQLGYGTKPVGQKLPNAFGLYDMHGNMWEWCQDWYGTYPGGSVTDPTGPASYSHRVLRSGAWILQARYHRSATRTFSTPANSRWPDYGFRVASVR